MRLITPGSLLLGLALSAPTLIDAFNDPAADITAALLRFVLAVVVAGAGLSFVSGLVAMYRAQHDRTADADGATTITTLPGSERPAPTIIASDEVLPA